MKILTFVFMSISAFATTPTANPGTGFPYLVESLRQPGLVTQKTGLLIHSQEVAPFIKGEYGAKDLKMITEHFHDTLALKIDDRGLAKASDRTGDEKQDPTHYDAVWVRDSLWVYLGLQTQPENSAVTRHMLLTLLDYFASPDQLARFEHVIKTPNSFNGPDGAMNVVHIRFDGHSPTFQDVTENGQPQRWNHKQNDALGLFLDLVCRAVLDGSLNATALTPARAKVITLLPAYFAALHFEAMEDAGSWEEIERVNTSSIALVTSGLERLQELLAHSSPAVVALLGPSVNRTGIADLVDKGYARIFSQLKAGGESPLYKHTDARYRKADAALLNVIYPARLNRLGRKDFDHVLFILKPLIGKAGIRRYLGDSYQSGNFWFEVADTTDTSSRDSFSNRGKRFIAGSEAQWFFDSWYSTALGVLYARFHDRRYRTQEIVFLNRALAQITGGTPQKPQLAADGRPVKALALPESYNTILDFKSKQSFFTPSPITPLNWAKASLRLALQTLSQACKP